MPIRAYASPWVVDQTTNTYSPAVASVIEGQGNSWNAIDLRSTAEIGTTLSKAVVFADVRPPDHNEIMQVAGVDELRLGMTEAELVAIFGPDIIPLIGDVSTIEGVKAAIYALHKARK